MSRFNGNTGGGDLSQINEQLDGKATKATNESTAINGQVLTANGDGTSTFKAPPSGTGGGDMLKSFYDSNNNGKVDHAENADSVDWTGVNNKPTFATVATSGSYNDLANKPNIPSAYTLPTASSTILGGVKIGTGVSIDANGVISVSGGGGSSSGGTSVNDEMFPESTYIDLNGMTISTIVLSRIKVALGNVTLTY